MGYKALATYGATFMLPTFRSPHFLVADQGGVADRSGRLRQTDSRQIWLPVITTTGKKRKFFTPTRN